MGTDIGTTARAAPGGRRRRAGTLTSRVDAAGSGTASEPSPPNPVAARIRAQTPRRCPGRPHFWEQRPHRPADRPRDGVCPNGATPTRATWDGESESRHQESPWAPFAQKGRCAEPRLPAAVERRPLGRRERQADESPARRSHPGLGNICRQPMRIGGNSLFFLISHHPAACRIARSKPPPGARTPLNTRREPCTRNHRTGTCDNGTAPMCADNP